MTDIPQVVEKATKPAGLLPKNVQAWLLVGLAFAMVAIMWLTGGKKPPVPAKPLSQLPAPAPAEVNQTKIAEMQNRIEDLQREQLVAQSALAQQTRLLGETAPDPPQTAQSSGVVGPPEQKAEDPIVAERKRRDYVSLFASNVALTYRTPLTHAAPEAEPRSVEPTLPSPEADAAQMAQLLKQVQASAAPPAASAPGAGDSPQAAAGPKEEHKNPPVQNHAAGQTYVVFEGTVLETILINRLDGEFSGPVECLLSNNVYSNDRQHLLVPAGSKLLGETRKVDTFGQSRLAVVFHRAIMPDGYSVSLDQFKGLNQTGDTGLRDEVNNHYLRIFGVSLAIGALGAVAEAGTNGSLNASSSDSMRQGFAVSTAQSSAQILDKFLNVMPTVTIREGHRVKVYLSGDLALPDYTNHIMPSDL
jgi:type IV secretion system protein VirB10